MQVITCVQGSEEWYQARSGCLTASNFADAVSVLSRASGDKKAGDPTAASDEVIAAVAIEIISGKPFKPMFETFATREGHAQEPEARFAYEARTGSFVDEAGVVKTDDGRFGYSTDGFVGTDGAIEVKTLVSGKRIAEFLANPEKVCAEFRAQCIGGLWITGRKWIDLIVWIPQLESVGRHLNIFRITRDDDEIEALETKLVAALRRIDALVASLRAPVAGATPSPSPTPSPAPAAAVELNF